jgi:xanthine/uracil/vitamin C permease (AzgA family)
VQASGMGLNAFFVYTVCIGFVLPYANALFLILAEGIVFILLTQNWGDMMPMVVTLCTFLAIVITSHKNVRGAVLLCILGSMGLYYLLGLTVPGFMTRCRSALSVLYRLSENYTTSPYAKNTSTGEAGGCHLRA